MIVKCTDNNVSFSLRDGRLSRVCFFHFARWSEIPMSVRQSRLYYVRPNVAPEIIINLNAGRTLFNCIRDSAILQTKKYTGIIESSTMKNTNYTTLHKTDRNKPFLKENQ